MVLPRLLACLGGIVLSPKALIPNDVALGWYSNKRIGRVTHTYGNLVMKSSKNFYSVQAQENGHNFIDSDQNELISNPKKQRLEYLQLLCFEFSQISTIHLSNFDGSGENRN